VCKADALVQGDNDKIKVLWENCTACLACTEVCPAEALIAYGEEKSVREVIDQVEKDASFYARSGGGLTLSGGEPLAQAEFAIALLKEARLRSIKSAIETCGNVKKEDLLEACRYCNMIMFDLKSMDSRKHKAFTGFGNERILHNFIELLEMYPKIPLRVRTPVVPGFNDSKKDIQAIVDFLKGKNVEFELLAYHKFGTQKYTNIGQNYSLGEISLDNDTFLRLQKVARQNIVTIASE
jgi:pyruvate formate lyase activating enzyme